MPGMAEQKSTPKVIKIAVNPKAKKVIEDTADELGMKEQAVASRVYEWFAQQDDVTKKHVLSLLPTGHEAEILKSAAARIEAKRKGGRT
jgi:hypothetical protein